MTTPSLARECKPPGHRPEAALAGTESGELRLKVASAANASRVPGALNASSGEAPTSVPHRDSNPCGVPELGHWSWPGLSCGPLVFAEKAAEDGPALDPLLGEVSGGVVGPGR